MKWKLAKNYCLHIFFYFIMALPFHEIILCKDHMKKYTVFAYAIIIISSLITMPTHAWLDEVDIDTAQVELIKTLEMRFCYISFVRINGKEYIVKQKKSDYFKKIVSVVRDTITAHIAEDFNAFITYKLDIAHRVAIIPAGKKFPGKPRTEWPATLHTIAPGKMIKAQTSNYDKMNIKQANIGFRHDMIAWMMTDPILIMIVALDTFVCNHDRHRGNLFYNASTNSFCAIDMDSSYKYNLCSLACKNFTEMINDKRFRLTQKEIEVLKTYKKHLEFLIAGHTPEDSIALYESFAEHAGFIPGSSLYTEKIAIEIERNKRMIRESYKDVLKLMPILDNLIKVSKKRLKEIW
jgi:hypothetical protein